MKIARSSGDIVVCMECRNEISELGLGSHVIKIHGFKSLLEYKLKYFPYTCKYCNKTIAKGKFCNSACAKNAQKEGKILYDHAPKSGPKECLICNKGIKPRGISGHLKYHSMRMSEYESLILSKNTDAIIKCYLYSIDEKISTIAKTYGVSTGSVRNVLLDNNVSIRTATDVMKIKREIKFKEEIRKYAESEDGKNIVSEYSRFGGTIKGLSKKLQVNVRTIRKVLTHNGILIKKLKQAKSERDEIHKQNGGHGPRYGKGTTKCSGSRCNWYRYKGILFQGSWELGYGIYLIENNIPFVPHPNIRFKYIDETGADRTYSPDFYLPTTEEYIEVKGYYHSQGQYKMVQVMKEYPTIKLNILFKNDLDKIGVFDLMRRKIVDFRYYEISIDDKLLVEELINKEYWNRLLFEYDMCRAPTKFIMDKFEIKNSKILKSALRKSGVDTSITRSSYHDLILKIYNEVRIMHRSGMNEDTLISFISSKYDFKKYGYRDQMVVLKIILGTHVPKSGWSKSKVLSLTKGTKGINELVPQSEENSFSYLFSLLG